MLGANTMWGLMSPMAKFVMASGAIGPLVITDLRISGAAALFWLASFFTRPERVAGKDMAKLFGASMLAIVLNQGCFIFGVSLTSPVNASIITTSMPLIVMILAAVILKEAVTGRKVLGIAAGALGAMLLVLGSGHDGNAAQTGSVHIFGDLLVFFAQFSYALYIVLYKNLAAKYSPFTILKWMFTYSFICLAPFSYSGLTAAGWGSLTIGMALALVFIVAGSTFGSYLLMLIGQKNLKPTVAGMYNYVQPLVASAAALCWGMDSFNMTKVVSAALIFGGVYLVSSAPGKAGNGKRA